MGDKRRCRIRWTVNQRALYHAPFDAPWRRVLVYYWGLFVLWALGAVQFARTRANWEGTKPFAIAAVATTLLIGLRYEVGGDWFAYLNIYAVISLQPLPDALHLSDPGYAFFNWLGGQFEWGVWFVNLACASVFMLGLTRLASRQPNPWLAMLVAVPYLIIVVGMGYTRQAAAIGVICFAIADASEKRIVRLVVLVAIAALFHKTAVLMLPIMLLPIIFRNFLVGAIGVMAFVMIFTFFLGGSSDRLLNTYVQSNYDSQGAAIRIAMNVAAAVVFLVLRKRMDLPPFIASFWTVCALLSLVSMIALMTLSASSGVDRISLFLIPLQMVTFSRLPYALSNSSRSLPSITLAVIASSLAVQFVWLNYASNADAWLPYSTTLTAT